MLEIFIPVFLLLVWMPSACGTQQITVTFEMQEETAFNTTIGSIRENLRHSLNSEAVFIYQGDFFNVESVTGVVRVATVIDRETLCQEHKQCCGLIDCVLSRSIYIMGALDKAYLATVQLQVRVTDINDNQPVFGSRLQRVSIPENSQVGRYIGLEPAIDADMDPQNQVNQYQWLEPTGTFSLDQTSLPSVRLRLKSPIDRELKANYSGTLSACDIDSCTKSEVLIEVSDINDNSPQFLQRQYRLDVVESLSVGSSVLRLNATDADSGDNARIMFSYRGTIDPDLAATFEIMRSTGEIRLRRPLDANIRSRYNFKVVACDSVVSDCAGNDASMADIEITVKDINDNRPLIEITPSDDYILSNYDIEVRENSAPGQIAVVKVRDDDIGDNARTTCELGSQTSPAALILSQSAPDFYSLRTIRSFNFEEESVITATIHCRDFGSPSLSAVRAITLRIIDLNEYEPEFKLLDYTSSIRENSLPGVEVVTVSATDKDGQSVLHYSLAAPPLQRMATEDLYDTKTTPSSLNPIQTLGVNAHFILDPETGVLRTSVVPLDREAIETISLIVTVTDSLTQPVFTATATISINIIDENDNSPVFVSPPPNMGLPFYQHDIQSRAFTVRENAPRYTRLSGRLVARDPDAGRNGQLHFSLRSVWALKGGGISYGHSGNGLDTLGNSPGRQLVEQRIFRITPDGGIETLVEFDRELVATYLVDVAVRDNGTQPLATSTTLLVLVLDENDNTPVWTLPSDLAREINITTANPPGVLVARLQAFDFDADESGKVEFQVLDPKGQPIPPMTLSRGLHNSQMTTSATITPSFPEELMGYRTGPFYLNGSTGEILVADRLVPISLKIRLRAIDCGQEQRLFSDTWMIINVKMDPNEFGGFLSGRSGALNVTIILVMIVITAVISLLLIVAIVCVRRKPARGVMGNGGVLTEPDYNGGVTLVTCSPGSPFLLADSSKEVLAANTWVGSPKEFFPSGPGSLIIDETGQVVSSTTLSCGSPSMNGGVDKTHILYGMPQHGPLYTPSEFAGPTQAYGTVSRSLRRGVSSSGSRIGSGGKYEQQQPPLDADSGDSGRGPSEDGNQFLMLESQRLFPNHPVYQYNLCTTYRPSSRMSCGYRSASAMGALVGATNSPTYMQHAQNNTDRYDYYPENRNPVSGTAVYTDSVDSKTFYPQNTYQRSPLGAYGSTLSDYPSVTQQLFNPEGTENTASISVGSLPRSRPPSRSTVTFQSPSVNEAVQQPIKLDLRGPGETHRGSFSTLPPRPVPRTVTNLDSGG